MVKKKHEKSVKPVQSFSPFIANKFEFSDTKDVKYLNYFHLIMAQHYSVTFKFDFSRKLGHCWLTVSWTIISGGGGWGGDRELQETPDTVFITGLSENIVEEDLMAHFGSIGVIKVGTFSR